MDGRVKVNGNIINELGTKVKPGIDKVEFDDKEINNNISKHTYILLNKPIGYVTTVKDQFSRDTVIDLVKVNKRLVPVGRLDMYTSGALILTDDGEFVYIVTHPKHEIEKTYTVTLKGIIEESDVQKLRDGVEIDGEYKTKKARVRILKIDKETNRSRLEITIHEGKNRQVRKIEVKNLKIGTWRYLTDSEVKSLLNTND